MIPFNSYLIQGNLIIMLTIITNRELHSPTYMLMFNLAIADILISGFVDSTAIHGILYSWQVLYL